MQTSVMLSTPHICWSLHSPGLVHDLQPCCHAVLGAVGTRPRHSCRCVHKVSGVDLERVPGATVGAVGAGGAHGLIRQTELQAQVEE